MKTFFILGALAVSYLLILEVFRYSKTKKVNKKFIFTLIVFLSIYILLLIQWIISDD